MEWEEKPEIDVSDYRLILTLGVLPSKAVECAIIQDFVTRSEFGTLKDIATHREIKFEIIKMKNDTFLWGQVSKPIVGQSVMLLANEIRKLKFNRVDILESFASQHHYISPGVFKLTSSNYPDLQMPNFPTDFAAQGQLKLHCTFKTVVQYKRSV